jgi:hypothetical protein
MFYKMKKDKRTYQDRKDYKNEVSKNDTVSLSDRYIVKLIKRHSILSAKEIRENTELINLYRLRVKLKRELKNAKQT